MSGEIGGVVVHSVGLQAGVVPPAAAQSDCRHSGLAGGFHIVRGVAEHQDFIGRHAEFFEGRLQDIGVGL